MVDIVLVRRGAYRDSVTLMLVSREAAAAPGAIEVAVVMATPLNLELITRRGFDLAESGELCTDDLVIAIRAHDEPAAAAIEAAVRARLDAPGDRAGASTRIGPGELAAHEPPRSITAATRRDPALTIASISVPGEHAAYEAARALDAGLHVFCFSSGVSPEDELALKRAALRLGLLLMGPDCGTSIIDGLGLGFANVVERGPVGIVGASGTGIQEICCLLDGAGMGISHAIGVGGRDLSAEVGGLMTRRALELLGADPDTEAIVLVCKQPDEVVLASLAVPDKPIVYAIPGKRSLEQAAREAALLFGRELVADESAATAAACVAGRPAAIAGLYSGGTLLLEATSVLAGTAGFDAGRFIDFGSEQLTAGRAHPMIDPTLRLERLHAESRDLAVGAILLDIVLGHGAHPDPAAQFAPVIHAARRGRPELTIAVSLCGTVGDPQDLERQRHLLGDAGAIVCRSAAAAARIAAVAVGAAT